ncbi:efflux RND transporter periplasmic adaptor subunit [Rufibacter glacialis]|uniref:Efflux RND transporter periplasmic adaptor subunit n=1 Tax=Rufibacter glacialis TaxID=1259555 RepID=A0A5M8Q6P0_9BACT|nr:efflux RND transporter periplasmic adaptor subunit [Rufibacter glacialis]KAA6430731.1 efflux RND transporter periplasmic adaptor subunit [Rufibacter glacialis]GGK86313.1 MexE family multidrug efflux RND transporter periplasmic adaptor subunit [Rufibacter glacialis]
MKLHLSIVAGLSLSTALLVSCGKKEAPQQNPMNAAVPVNTYTVTQEHVTGTDTYPGTVVPLNEVELRPQVSGYISQIFVKDGQKVTKGQKLYEIDRSKYQAAYNQAQANVRSAQANLNRVQKDLERYENLAKQDAIARQRVDYARADVETARANVAVARAQVASASTDLGYSIIKAPFSGTIGISQVRVGSQVSPGQTLLNTISSEGPTGVDFVINEQELPRFNRLRQGKQPDSLFTLTLSGGSTYPHTGKLTAIDRAVGLQSGTITVRVSFPNPDRQLVAGMTVSVNVLNQDIGQQLTLPYRAVTEQLGEYFVYKVLGDSVQQQNVLLGTRFQDKIVAREGLKEGDVIVVEGIQKLRQGSKVQVGAPQAAGGAPAAGAR